jgi:hypothetical protein
MTKKQESNNKILEDTVMNHTIESKKENLDLGSCIGTVS